MKFTKKNKIKSSILISIFLLSIIVLAENNVLLNKAIQNPIKLISPVQNDNISSSGKEIDMVFWGNGSAYNYFLRSTLGDMDNDGMDELIAIGYNTSADPDLTIWNIENSSISLIASKKVFTTTTSFGYWWLVCMDYDNDTLTEAIILRMSGSGDFRTTDLYSYNYTGGQLWSEYNQTLLSNSVYHSDWFDVCDIDEDGITELIHLGDYCGNPGVGDFRTHLTIWKFSAGSFSWIDRLTWTLVDPTWAGDYLICYDIDNDTKPEIITTSSPFSPWRLHIRIYGWNAGLNLEASNTFSADDRAKCRAIACGDFDDDGKDEFAVAYSCTGFPDAYLSIFNVSGASITLEYSTNWNTGVSGSMINALAAYDFDKDNRTELIIGGYDYESGISNELVFKSCNTSGGINFEENITVPVSGNNTNIRDLEVVNEDMLIVVGYNGSYGINCTGFIVQ
ncbi:MAG: hypothetical protein ACTSO9_21570, partial [Candidatus Helarchaeota archaeon]